MAKPSAARYHFPASAAVRRIAPVRARFGSAGNLAMKNDTTFTLAQRCVAIGCGLACHLSFGLGVLAMIVGLATGMQLGLGPFRGAWAVVADLVLLAQFPLLHSVLLSERGRSWLARLAPLGLGAALGTTTYATIASLQLLATFVLWSPIGSWQWHPGGAALAASVLAYAGAWLLLLKTMFDAGLDVQTGFQGWGAVSRGRKPEFRDFAPRGSFRWVRQPVYVAFALTLWTGPVWTIDHVLVAFAWTMYCMVAPRHKERRYSQYYGERFAHYRTLVPYWIPRRRPADLSALAGVARDQRS
jgi:protein-S-isoprenylcysteine O-methyltransferase Ste14